MLTSWFTSRNLRKKKFELLGNNDKNKGNKQRKQKGEENRPLKRKEVKSEEKEGYATIERNKKKWRYVEKRNISKE